MKGLTSESEEPYRQQLKLELELQSLLQPHLAESRSKCPGKQ